MVAFNEGCGGTRSLSSLCSMHRAMKGFIAHRGGLVHLVHMLLNCMWVGIVNAPPLTLALSVAMFVLFLKI